MEKIEDQKLFGLPIKHRTAEELQLLADSTKVLELLHKMYLETTEEYIKTRYIYPVSDDTNNIKEKLDYTRQIVIDRIFYTLKHLPELANNEHARRISIDKER